MWHNIKDMFQTRLSVSQSLVDEGLQTPLLGSAEKESVRDRQFSSSIANTVHAQLGGQCHELCRVVGTGQAGCCSSPGFLRGYHGATWSIKR